MKTGDIILVPFPFAEGRTYKVRPSVVIAETKDKYKDVIVSAISSVVPQKISENEILLIPDSLNNLRAPSVIKVDRLVTLKREKIITHLGKLSRGQLQVFKTKFKGLIK